VTRGTPHTSGASLEDLARERHLDGDYRGAIDAYERAYAAYRAEDALLAAARSARTVAWFRGYLYGEWALFEGWMGRARRVLEQAGEDSQEHGWVLLADAMAGDDLEEQRALYEAAIATALRYRDADLECEAVSRLGVMLVSSGHVTEGLRYVDEALAAVCGGDVQDLFVVEGIFCGLFNACEQLHDVARAEQWLRAADELAGRRRMPAIGGYCRAHYGGILTAAGRWAEAEDALTAAIRVFQPEHVRIRGNLLCRLAALRVQQGRLEDAAELLRGIEDYEDAVRPLAALCLARGETARARDVLERALAAGGMNDAAEGSLRGLLVDVHLADGDVDAARASADRLGALAESSAGPYLKALAALANGKVCVASGSGDARTCLHEAMARFGEAHLPVEQARCRLELARTLVDDGREVAVAEATAAYEVFERLSAGRDADAAAALLRSLGGPARTGQKGREGLSRREAEVLDLVGHGLTNAEIADRLFISAKTVEHHVGRVLAKLGLRSRVEAAAYAVRTAGARSAPD
jgi:DNA-binding CsgD family transcriptional regulator/tetratricopeptide (TPR) repeat protein